MDVESKIEDLSRQITCYLEKNQITEPAMVGIHTGGVWIAERLHQLLGIQDPLGTLDITFYRDDFTRKGLNPEVTPSNLPFDVEGRNIILVDDVLHTGRTIRAAMNELFDYGRPASISLVTLAERNGRELPIEASVNGEAFNLRPNQHIKVSGPNPLKLEILES